MQTIRIIALLFSILLILVAFSLIALAIIHYTALKSFANSVMPDGNFRALTESNALVFRLLLGGTGLALGALGTLIAGGHAHNVLNALRQYYADLGQFLYDLRPTTREIFPAVILLLVLACAAIFRVDHLNEQITHDEAYTYVVFSSTSIFNIVTNYHLPNNHILSSLLIDLSTHLFGAQPWAVRLPAFLAGLLLIFASYAFARQVYGKYAALLGSVIIAILPGTILYSSRGRGYVLVSFFTLLALLVANYLRKNNNLAAWSLLAVSMALGFYSVPVMLFPFGMVFAWLFFENLFANRQSSVLKMGFIKNWTLSGITTAALVLLLYTPIFIYSGPKSVFANQFVQPEPWGGYIASIPGKALAVWREWMDGFPWPVTLLLLAGFCLSLVLHRRLTQGRFPLQLAAFLGIGALLLIQRPTGQTKIWAFLQAPFMIWSAAGLMGLLQILPIKPSRKVFLAASIVVIACAAITVNAIQVIPRLHASWVAKGPVENTAIAIHNQISPNDLIIVDSPFDAPVWYYTKLLGLSESYFDQSRSFDRLFVIVNPTGGQTLQSVLQSRGPGPELFDAASAQPLFSMGFLDTYLVPHR